MLLSLAPLLIMQVGINPAAGGMPDATEEVRNRPPRERAAGQAASPTDTPRTSRLQTCLELARVDAEQAQDEAQAWLSSAQGSERARANHCLGEAYANAGQWNDAVTALTTAIGQAAASDHAYLALLGTFAGNSAIMADQLDRAVSLLDAAEEEAGQVNDPTMASGIALDKVRALILLERLEDAAPVLATVRQTLPNSVEAWLNSATVARLSGNLAEAQAFIEHAAEIAPTNLSVGLEAGTIAYFSGREASARRSWQSVIDAAPDSEDAALARTYLQYIDRQS